MNPQAQPRPSEPLAQALARAARVLDAQQPPPQLREAVLRRVARAPSPQPGGAGHTPRLALRPARRWWAWSGGAAVAAMLVGASALLVLAPPAAVPQRGGGEFLPLVPREDWPDEASPAWLVSSELPQERLAALGLPYDPARAAERVRAELLVHPSGLVLALRLID
jgi:hypothetical protein